MCYFLFFSSVIETKGKGNKSSDAVGWQHSKPIGWGTDISEGSVRPGVM